MLYGRQLDRSDRKDAPFYKKSSSNSLMTDMQLLEITIRLDPAPSLKSVLGI